MNQLITVKISDLFGFLLVIELILSALSLLFVYLENILSKKGSKDV